MRCKGDTSSEMTGSMRILEVNVDMITMVETVRALESRLRQNRKSFVVTANAEIIMMCQKDPAYKEILNSRADFVLPDGAGAVWAGRYLGYEVKERVTGFDLCNNLLKLSAAQGWKVYLLGGMPGIAEAARRKAESMYPGVRVVGVHDGYFSDDETGKLIDEINRSGAQMLFVALGAPKQELFIAEHKDMLDAVVLMGIGGSLDVLAGKMARAPKWMQDASLEWAFRLYKQPGRFIRMLALPKFAIKVMLS